MVEPEDTLEHGSVHTAEQALERKLVKRRIVLIAQRILVAFESLHDERLAGRSLDQRTNTQRLIGVDMVVGRLERDPE